jgi:hypothetical protein
MAEKVQPMRAISIAACGLLGCVESMGLELANKVVEDAGATLECLELGLAGLSHPHRGLATRRQKEPTYLLRYDQQATP